MVLFCILNYTKCIETLFEKINYYFINTFIKMDFFKSYLLLKKVINLNEHFYRQNEILFTPFAKFLSSFCSLTSYTWPDILNAILDHRKMVVI